MPPRKVGPNYIRTIVASWAAGGGAAALAPDFAAVALATVFGGAGGAGFQPGYWVEIEKVRFIVGNAAFAGTGPVNFELRKTEAGPAICTISITLAAAVRGAVIEGLVSAANDEAAKIRPGDALFLVRTATGAAFTGGEGQWEIVGRQPPQSKGT